ncbi:MAG TPA: HlyD family secretion protein [Steroidobacteraceae bacterium]|jgi:membrane fusion protein (multidrug efflux system)
MSASSNAEHRAVRENSSDKGERDRQDAEGQDAEGQDAEGHDPEGHDRGKAHEPRKPSLLHRPRALIAIGAVLLVLLAVGAIWWWHASGFENTDDAFIDARTVRVAPRVSGQVSGVLVTDNQFVRAGQVLAEIDPADTQSVLDQAAAQQSQADTALGQAQADVQVAETQRKQAIAAESGADAQALNAEQDLRRYRALKASTPQAVAQGQLDQAIAAARSAAAQRESAREQIRGADAQIVAARAAVAGAEARLETSHAQLHQAQLNLGYTRVLAPVDGHIARRTVAVGSYVAPGQELLAIVPLQVWVTANFKENQLARIRPGQSVTVHVDACPGVDLDARVDSIQRGAGQAFALLPAENATGNFVKVVQRVPVKIVLEDLPRNCPLGPGMSVEPSVRVR